MKTKRLIYFTIVLTVYLTTHYIIECVESGLVMSPVSVITWKKLLEAISFSTIMLVVWMFSPKENIAEKKEN